MTAMHWGLFAVGTLRFFVWAAGCVWAVRNRLYLAAAGFGLAAFNGVVFTFLNAGARVPSWLNTVATLVTFPTATIIVVSVVYAWHGLRLVDVLRLLANRRAK